jgi:hypothetical protein
VTDDHTAQQTVPFSAQLEAWLHDDTPKTLGALGTVFAERSFAVAVLLLMFVPALPLPTGGISHVFEVITIAVAGQMVLGRRTIWLPRRWKDRPLGALTTDKAVPFIGRRVRWFERLSRGRGSRLLERRTVQRVVGVLIALLALAALLAPPFSGLDTLPSLGAVVIALSVILGDVIVLAVGVVIGAGGVLLTLTVGATVFHWVRHWV